MKRESHEAFATVGHETAILWIVPMLVKFLRGSRRQRLLISISKPQWLMSLAQRMYFLEIGLSISAITKNHTNSHFKPKSSIIRFWLHILMTDLLTACKVNLSIPLSLSELVAGNNDICAPLSIKNFRPVKQSWICKRRLFVTPTGLCSRRMLPA